MSTTIFMYMVLSFRKEKFCRSPCEMNIGQPDTIFISVVGRLKLELVGTGRNVSEVATSWRLVEQAQCDFLGEWPF